MDMRYTTGHTEDICKTTCAAPKTSPDIPGCLSPRPQYEVLRLGETLFRTEKTQSLHFARSLLRGGGIPLSAKEEEKLVVVAWCAGPRSLAREHSRCSNRGARLIGARPRGQIRHAGPCSNMSGVE